MKTSQIVLIGIIVLLLFCGLSFWLGWVEKSNSIKPTTITLQPLFQQMDPIKEKAYEKKLIQKQHSFDSLLVLYKAKPKPGIITHIDSIKISFAPSKRDSILNADCQQNLKTADFIVLLCDSINESLNRRLMHTERIDSTCQSTLATVINQKNESDTQTQTAKKHTKLWQGISAAFGAVVAVLLLLGK